MSWPVRYGCEQWVSRDLKVQFSLDKLTRLTKDCVLDLLESNGDVVQPDLDWGGEKGLQVKLQGTEAYATFLEEVGDTRGFQSVLDPMCAWTTLSKEHPDKVVASHFEDKARKHAALQFCCIYRMLWKDEPIPHDSEQIVRAFVEQVAETWGVLHELRALDIWKDPMTQSFLKGFLARSIGVIGKHNRSDSDPQGLEFRIRATSWQEDWLTIWMWIQFVMLPKGKIKAKALSKLTRKSPILALMLEYYVSGDRSFLESARQKDPLVADVFLFRFALRRYSMDETDARSAIEQVAERRLRVLRQQGQLSDSFTQADAEDCISDVYAYKCCQSTDVLPPLQHANYPALIREVVNNYIRDWLTKWRRVRFQEQPDVVANSHRRDNEDSRTVSRIEKAESIDLHLVTAEQHEVIPALLTRIEPRIRRRLAFWIVKYAQWFPLYKEVPNAWVATFHADYKQRKEESNQPFLTVEQLTLKLQYIIDHYDDIHSRPECQQELAVLWDVGSRTTVPDYAKQFWATHKDVIKPELL